MDIWHTALTEAKANNIRISGYDIAELMRKASFTDTVFLLHRGRLPDDGERQLLSAILVAVSDHGPGSPSAATARIAASGNRAAPEAAVGAGVLAIGDAHAGAGLACMELIAEVLALSRSENLSLESAARQAVSQAREAGTRIPGVGHRVHTADPRTAVLISLAQEVGKADDGIEAIMAIEKAVAEVIKPLPVNLDGALAAVLFDLGFPPLFGKLVFIVGRVAGLSAHVLEEYTRERPMRVRVPVAYDGPPPRDLDGDA